MCAADSSDAGSSDTAKRGPGSVGLPAEALWAPDFAPMEDFPLEQSRDCRDQRTTSHCIPQNSSTTHPVVQ